MNPGPTFAYPPPEDRFHYRPISEMEPTLAGGLGIAGASAVDNLTQTVGYGFGLAAVLGRSAVPALAHGSFWSSVVDSTGHIPKPLIGTITRESSSKAAIPPSQLAQTWCAVLSRLTKGKDAQAGKAASKRGAKGGGKPTPQPRSAAASAAAGSADADHDQPKRRRGDMTPSNPAKEEPTTPAHASPSGKRSKRG